MGLYVIGVPHFASYDANTYSKPYDGTGQNGRTLFSRVVCLQNIHLLQGFPFHPP